MKIKAQLNNEENAISSGWSIKLSITRFIRNESFLNTKMTASTQAVNWNVERNIKTRRGNSRNVSNITHFYFLLFNPEWWWVTWSSGGPPSSLMSSKKLWPSTTTSFLNLPPSGDSSWNKKCSLIQQAGEIFVPRLPACSSQSDICERVPTFQTRDFQLFPVGFRGHFLTASTLGSSRRNLEQEMIKYFYIFLHNIIFATKPTFLDCEVRCVHNMVQAGARCRTRNNSFSVTVTRAKLSHSQTLVHLLTTK